MPGSLQSSSPMYDSPLSYRTGFYVGALHGYQIVSEVSPVDGPDFCQGFAAGIEVVLSWVKQYLSEGGTFDGALGELMPYFPALRAWVNGGNATSDARVLKPPTRRERQRRKWQEDVTSALTDDKWWTSKEIAERLNGRGPHSLRTLNHLLDDMATSGQVERSRTVDLFDSRNDFVRWRLASTSKLVTPTR